MDGIRQSHPSILKHTRFVPQDHVPLGHQLIDLILLIFGQIELIEHPPETEPTVGRAGTVAVTVTVGPRLGQRRDRRHRECDDECPSEKMSRNALHAFSPFSIGRLAAAPSSHTR
jgi:hypothetical protein